MRRNWNRLRYGGHVDPAAPSGRRPTFRNHRRGGFKMRGKKQRRETLPAYEPPRLEPAIAHRGAPGRAGSGGRPSDSWNIVCNECSVGE
jgi:hypothetical protein